MTEEMKRESPLLHTPLSFPKVPQLHTPRTSTEPDTTEADPQDPNQQEESNLDADSNPSFDTVPQDELEDELESCVGFIMRATHKADDLLAANVIASWIFRQNRMYCWQALVIARHHEGRWTKFQPESIDIN